MNSKIKFFCSALLIALPFLAHAQNQNEIDQLKAYQAKLRANDSDQAVQALQSNGYNSAHQIAAQPPSYFVQNDASATTGGDPAENIRGPVNDSED